MAERLHSNFPLLTFNLHHHSPLLTTSLHPSFATLYPFTAPAFPHLHCPLHSHRNNPLFGDSGNSPTFAVTDAHIDEATALGWAGRRFRLRLSGVENGINLQALQIEGGWGECR